MTPHLMKWVRHGAVLLIVLSGCAGTREPISGGEETRVQIARDLFEQGKYDQVIADLNQLMADRPGSRYVEESTFLIGKSYYEKGLYIDAEEQFRRYRREFPAGEFAAQSSYYLGLALLSQSRSPQLDQTETRAALTQFNSFITQYPDNELVERARMHVANIRSKLAEKQYLNGKLYLRRGYIDAARFYFKERILEPYGDTPWAVPAMLGLAKSYEKTKDWTEAAEWAEKLLATYPDSEEADEAKHILDKSSQHLGSVNESPADSAAADSASPR